MQINFFGTPKEQVALEKEISHLKGFLQGRGYEQSIMALNFAKRSHNNQKRKTGEPYIMHPVRVCSYLTALNVLDDNILAIALLHDVVEDCNVSITKLTEYGFNERVTSAVDVLSKNKEESVDDYYKEIITCTVFGYPEAGIVKLSDRCNNISTMAGAFNKTKIEEYIYETEKYIYNICKTLKEYCPQYADQVFVMKYGLEGMIKAYKLFLNTIDKDEKGND